MKVIAEKRQAQGTGASRRLRRANKVPGIIYGAGFEPSMIEVNHNDLFHALRKEQFHSTVLDLELGKEKMQVLLRDFQMHPYKKQVMHIDFQRVAADQPITMSVPLHFVNEELSPAVKLDKCLINHVLTQLQVSCLPANLPEFIKVDLAGLTKNNSLHVSSLQLPQGVTAVTKLGEDPVVVTPVATRQEDEVIPTAAPEATAVPAVKGGDKPDAAAPAAKTAGAKPAAKPAAKK